MAETYFATTLQESLQNYLRERADELDLNIRVAAPFGGTVDEDTYGEWTSASEPKVDLCPWGALSRRQAYDVSNDLDVWHNNAQRSAPDVLVVEDSADFDQVRMPRFNNDDRVVVEYQPGLIASLIPIHAVRHVIRWDEVLGPAIRAQVDDTYYNTFEERRAEAQRRQFVEFVTRRNDDRFVTLREEITEQEQQLVTWLRRVDSTRTRLENDKALLSATLAQIKTPRTDDELIADYDAIGRHAKIVRSRFVGTDQFSVRTSGIELTHPHTNESTIVGEFEIVFNFATGEIDITNLTNPRGELHHPHVRDGELCLGELYDTTHELLRKRELSALVNVIIEALSHAYPEDDYGQTVYLWFDEEAEQIAEYQE